MHGCVTLAKVTQEAAPFTVVREPGMRQKNIATIGETSNNHGGVPSGTPDSYSG